MAEPVYTSPAAELLTALETFLRTDPDTGKPRYGLRHAALDTAAALPPGFPAALIVPGPPQTAGDGEVVWPVSIALITPAAQARTGLLALCDLQYQLVRDLLDYRELLSTGWTLDDATGYDPQVLAYGDPNKPAPRQLYWLGVTTLTARRLD